MMHLPDSFKRFTSIASRFPSTDIEFSGRTYQVQIFDPDTNKHEWAFVQLDRRGKPTDCFCSCELGDQDEPCVHIVAAFMRIYQNKDSPLHCRFERSLWKVLTALYAKSAGDDVAVLFEIGNGDYVHRSAGGKILFEIKGLTKNAKEKIEELVHHRRRETEETSLKFSNLSSEELTLWREGRPSEELMYELSFWGDFAKWLMVLQDGGAPYRISYEYDIEGLPCYILAEFREVVTGFYLSKANLPLVIPALATIKSLLKVYGGTEKNFRKVSYDKTTGVLLLEPFPKTTVDTYSQDKGIQISGWCFVKGMGFYPSDQKKIIGQSSLKGKEISNILNEHRSLLKTSLEGATIHEDPVAIAYALAFDDDWNLHISAYLFNPGDLTKGDSRFFGDWAYLDDDGFYLLQGVYFPEIETIVPAGQIGPFITRNRSWFNAQEGFQTHVLGVEAQMRYQVSDNGQLMFFRALQEGASPNAIKEFTPWVYVPEQGFYAKTSINVGLPIKPGVALHPNQISHFIRTNAGDLQLVPGFFNSKNPIVSSTLSVELDENSQIVIRPQNLVAPEFADRKLHFFDDYVYVEGEGFSELPTASRLPLKYRQEVCIESKDVDTFILYEMEALQPYISMIDRRLIRPGQLNPELISLDQEKDRLYKLKLKYVSEQGSVSAADFWKGMKKRQRFLFSDAGLIDLHDKSWSWIHWLGKGQVDARAQTVHLSNWELMRLDAFGSLTPKDVGHGEIRKILHELLDCTETTDLDLTGLNSSLRPYQEAGVRWLWFLYQQGLSGLLCDDMGLGKTHQTMALLAAVHHAAKSKENLRFLVVCPTSVLYHWQEKLAQFLPDFRVFTFYGINRTLEGLTPDHHVLLTSYGIWRQDVGVLSELSFEVAVFDEIQIAKNHSSLTYGSLKSVKAKMRLGLTGTPIENHLRELKSLFDLVLDGYMPGEIEYRELFVRPVEKGNDSKQKALLSRLIKPFVLRRKKEDVLFDLPEKIEEVSRCDLTEEQKSLYENVLLRSREKIFRELEDENMPIPYIHIFALLSSLKQVCDHPAVYLKKVDNYKNYSSGKWDLFLELLEEARESQQKVVVFSQYLHMLDIMEAHLNQQGVGFASIRGSTQNRGEQLKRFSKDPTCEVFLASLQASGLGIDLTSASVVIHYDRWWNAARENQATDRVHRIGQTRGVQVFKLVTKNTFEERIDQLITQKGRLMEDVIGVDERDMIKKFTREEIFDLLRLVK